MLCLAHHQVKLRQLNLEGRGCSFPQSFSRAQLLKGKVSVKALLAISYLILVVPSELCGGCSKLGN